MNSISRLAGLVLLFLFFSLNSIAQYSDFRTWSALSVSKELVKDLKAEVEIGQRFKENSQRYDRSLITASLQYVLVGDLKIEGGYRYLLVQSDELAIESRYRIHSDLSWKYSFGDFSLRFKERVQYGFDDLSIIGDAQMNKIINRSRLGAAYNIFGTPISLHGSYEHFLLLNDPDAIYTAGYRFKGGAKYALNSKMELELSYMLDQEINKVNPVCSHIVFVGLSYDL